MADVNFLKRTNDTYGHEKGNEYLKNASDRVARVFGTEHTYRVGGDEFVVVLEGEAQRDAGEKIRQFRQAVAQSLSQKGLEPWQRVSMAIDIAACEPGRDTCTEDVFKRADAAMYAEKQAMKAERHD